MPGQRDVLGDLVVASTLDADQRLLAAIDQMGLQRGVQFAVVHRRWRGSECLEGSELDGRLRNAQLQPFQIRNGTNGFAVGEDVPKAGIPSLLENVESRL